MSGFAAVLRSASTSSVAVEASTDSISQMRAKAVQEFEQKGIRPLYLDAQATTPLVHLSYFLGTLYVRKQKMAKINDLI